MAKASEGTTPTELIDRIVQYAREHEAAVRFNGPFVGNMEARLKAEIAHLKALLAHPPKHRFWSAGEPDCPAEIKAANGELWQLRCKICGEDDPRQDWCWSNRPPDLAHQVIGLEAQLAEMREVIEQAREVIGSVRFSEIADLSGESYKERFIRVTGLFGRIYALLNQQKEPKS